MERGTTIDSASVLREDSGQQDSGRQERPASDPAGGCGGAPAAAGLPCRGEEGVHSAVVVHVVVDVGHVVLRVRLLESAGRRNYRAAKGKSERAHEISLNYAFILQSSTESLRNQ